MRRDHGSCPLLPAGSFEGAAIIRRIRLGCNCVAPGAPNLHHPAVPRTPAHSAWSFEPAPDDHPEDLWALGADLEPGTLLQAYRLGLFPMPLGPGLGWFSPLRRAVVPLDTFAPSRSLRRAARRYEIRVDTAFAEVVAGCARPGEPESWIDEGIEEAYRRLHELGFAHSVEAWDADGLAGGLYGISLGGLFAAESMYHVRTDASKAAFVRLVGLLREAGDADHRILDVQWLTLHLASLGAIEISRAEYRRKLATALPIASPFAGCPSRQSADVVGEADHEQQEHDADPDD
jgi:leucyl/phenylalanyl-tRNA---protein transferase